MAAATGRLMATPRSLIRQLNLWTLIAVAVFVFGVAMIARVATDGADPIAWTLFAGLTLASAAVVAWLVSLRA